jgi:hypothetical protein
VETTRSRKRQFGNELSSEVVRRQDVAGIVFSSSTPAASTIPRFRSVWCRLSLLKSPSSMHLLMLWPNRGHSSTRWRPVGMGDCEPGFETAAFMPH